MDPSSWIPPTPLSNMPSHPPACDFAKKLYKILEDKSVEHIVSWTAKRDRFVVRDVNQFTKLVLPNVYKHSNFASFVRQLNKYDFHKIKNAENDGDFGGQDWIFYHPNFHANGRGDLENIKRKVPVQRKAVKSSEAANDRDAASSTHTHTHGSSSNHPSTSRRSPSPNSRYDSPAHYHTASDSDLAPRHNNPFQIQISTLQTQLSALQTQLASLAASNSTLSAQLRTITETQASLVSESATLRQDLNAMRQKSPHSQSSLSPSNGSLELANPIDGFAFPLGRYPTATTTPSPRSSIPSTMLPSSPRSASLDSPPNNGDNLDPNAETVATSAALASDAFTMPVGQFGADELNGMNIWLGDESSKPNTWAQANVNAEALSIPSPSVGLLPRSTSPSSLYVGITNSLQRSKSPATPGWTVPPRVLLVDDDIVSRKLGSKVLQVCGCTIDVAVDGLGAVSKMNLEKYDLVLMDIMMPKLDGVTATSLIRKFDLCTPIISMTSNSSPGQIMSYYSSGMNDILPKPVTKDGVLEVLEKHLIHLKRIQQMSRAPLSVGLPFISEDPMSSIMHLLPAPSSQTPGGESGVGGGVGGGVALRMSSIDQDLQMLFQGTMDNWGSMLGKRRSEYEGGDDGRDVKRGRFEVVE